MKQVQTHQEFQNLISSNGGILVDFYAVWCGPCKVISPVFESLSGEYPMLTCVKVDVDQLPSVAQQEDITAMPTFVLYVNGKRESVVRGADRNSLESMFRKGRDLVATSAAFAKKNYSAMPREELLAMGAKQLKLMIAECGLDITGCVEKKDLVDLLLKK